MPTDTEQQARLSALEAEIATLRHLTNRMLQGGLFDMLTGHGYQYFGGGAWRVDNFGAQMKAEAASDDLGIFFVSEFTANNPKDLRPIFWLDGWNDGVSSGQMRLVGFSSADLQSVFQLSLTSGVMTWDWVLERFEGKSRTIVYRESIEDNPVLDLQGGNAPIAILFRAGSAVDNPTSFVDGLKWYSGVLDKFRGRANGTTENFAFESYVDAHTGDTSDAHDASAISILDAAGDFTATDVEGALAELQSDAEAHIAAADPHTGYVREADANWIDLTDGGATTLHSHAGSGWSPTVTAQSGTYTAADGDVVLCTGTFTVTLPAATANVRVIVKNVSTGTITVDGAGADTIDGVASLTLAQYDSVTLIADGTGWNLI